MNILLSLQQALTGWPDQLAVVDGEQRLTYGQLGQRVARLARALAQRGVQPHDVVAIVAPNGHQFIEAYYGCAWLGAVLAPINIRLSPREQAAIFLHARAKLLLAHRDFGAPLATALRQTDGPSPSVLWLGEEYESALAAQSSDFPDPPSLPSDQLAHLYFTSGTTGVPKGVMLTHGNVACHALAAIAELGLTDGDVWLHAAPMFHLADAWATFAITWVGGRHVCLPSFDAGAALAAIEQERITLTNLVPTMLNLLVHHPRAEQTDVSSLRLLLSGGAPIAPELVRRVVRCFRCEYVQTYGMTETSPYLTLSLLKHHLRQQPPEARLARQSRTGRPFLAVELKVVRPDGTEVARDDQEVGEIVARGPTVSPGYWNDEEATAQVFVDGWLHTGDLAVIDQEGYLNIVDRKKDVIISGGENIYSTEVEHVLAEHPTVLEVAVVGLPDDLWGEVVQAFVVTRPGMSLSESELSTFARARLARFKVPKRIVFLEELPKTGTGKIAKRLLRSQPPHLDS